MNPNDNDDAKLISQIDRRVQNDQPSGIPLVDDLAAAIPQPRNEFQQQLEDRLTAHYHHTQNGKGKLELVTHTPALDIRPQKKWAFIPLTLAAAMLAVVIIGSIILSPNRNGSQGGLAIGLQATLSPTPVGTILPNPAPVMGCDTPNAMLAVPVNGMVVFEPINVIGTAFTDNFGFYRFELNGPSTAGNFAMIRDYNQPVEMLGELGQFVPSFYQPGDYQFRLTVFDTHNTLRAACTINISVSEPISTPKPIDARGTAFMEAIFFAQTPTNSFEIDSLRKAVIALQDIPRGTQITSDMLTIAYFDKDSISDRTYYNSSLVEGRFAAQDIGYMEPITLDDISDTPIASSGVISTPLLDPMFSTVDANLASELEGPPTPIGSDLGPLVNVVVALQDLPRGYQFPATLAELDNIVDYMALPEAVIPLDALREDQNGLQQLPGRILKTEVYRQELVLPNLLANDVTQLTDLGNMTNFGIPPGQVSVLLPITISEVIASGIRERDYVDLVVSVLYTDLNETYQTLQPPDGIITLNPQDGSPPCPNAERCTVTQTQTIVHNVSILNIAEEATDMMVTLIVSPQDMIAINWMFEAKLPYILRRTIPEPVQLPSYPDQIPTGMWLSEIDINQIESVVSPINEGDLIDVTFSFLWPEVESEISNTLSPENGRVFTVTLLHGAKIYKLGDSIRGDKKDILTLLLTQEDMILLSSLLKTSVPHSITIIQSNEPELRALHIKDLPEGRLSVTLPIESVTVSDNAQWQSGGSENRVDVIANMTFHTSIADSTEAVAQGQPVSYLVLEDVEFITNTGGGGAPSDPTSESSMTATIAISSEDLNTLYSAVTTGIPLTLQLRAEE